MKKLLIKIIIIVIILANYAIPSFAAPITSESLAKMQITSTQEKLEVKEEVKLADNDGSLGGLLQAGKDFIQEGENSQEDGKGNSTTINQDNLENLAVYIYKIVLSIAVVLATVVGIIIGIQFMMASSADEKAKWKEKIKVYIVGVIVIYGALGIWFLALNILNAYTPDATKTQQEKQYEETMKETEESLRERKKVEQREKEEKKQQEELDEKRDERFNTWMRKH